MGSTVEATGAEFWLSIIIFRRNPFEGGHQSLPPALQTIVDASLAEWRRRSDEYLRVLQGPSPAGVPQARSSYIELDTGVAVVQHVLRAVLDTLASASGPARLAALAALGARQGPRPDPVLRSVLPALDRAPGHHDVFLLRLRPDDVGAGDGDGLPRPFRALVDLFVAVRRAAPAAGPGCYLYDGRHAAADGGAAAAQYLRGVLRQPAARLGRAMDALAADVAAMTAANLRDARETEALLAQGPLVDYSPLSAALAAAPDQGRAVDYSEWLQREEDDAAGVNDLMVFHSGGVDGGQGQ